MYWRKNEPKSGAIDSGVRPNIRPGPGVPDRQYRSISSGWREYYWEPLKKRFAK